MGFIRDIQKANGLTPDGIIGKKTLLKIKEIIGKTNVECAHFLGQCSHESGGFFVLEENLNYSAKRLLEIFGKYFNDKNVILYANKPEHIANRVYANRMGNGDELSGDGWKFRGRGLIQLTGKNNYVDFAKYINDPLILENPSLVSTKYALQSAKYFFDKNNIWLYCQYINDDTIMKVSKLINLGSIKSKLIPHGLKDRSAQTKKYYISLNK